MAIDWQTRPFSEAVTINPTVRLQRGQVYPYVDMKAIDPAHPFVSASEQRPFPGGGSRFEHGDTLFARITPCLENGKIARFDGRGSDDPAHGSTEFIVVRGRAGVTDSAFAFYLSRSTYVRNFAIGQMTGTSGRQRVPTDCFEKLMVSVPPLGEQSEIAKVLGALDDKIEQNRRTSRTLERLARTVFRAWFVDFEPVKAKAAGATAFPSMPQDIFNSLPSTFIESVLGPIPKGWTAKPIGDAVAVKGGATPSTRVVEYWEGGQHCWATPRDLSRLSDPVLLDTERRITDVGVAQISSGLLPAGTVLLSSRAPIGYLAIAGVPTAVNQGFIAMVCDGPLPPVYVFNWAHYAMEEIKGRASGTTFPEISKTGFRPISVVVPKPAVIEAFRRLVEPLFDLITATMSETDRLQAMRDYLLPRLLSGHVRVEVRHG